MFVAKIKNEFKAVKRCIFGIILKLCVVIFCVIICFIFAIASTSTTVSFGWTYNSLSVLYTPTLGAYFKNNIQTTSISQLNTDIGCSPPCSTSVTTGPDASNYLTVSMLITGFV